MCAASADVIAAAGDSIHPARNVTYRPPTLLTRLLRRVPMPVLSLVIGLGVGFGAWNVLDYSQREAVRQLFDQELRLRLDLRSRENLIRFDQYVGHYVATTRLLANHRRLALYLEPLFWFAEDLPQPQHYEGVRPYWLPDLISNTLVMPSQVLLVDTRGGVREIYRAGLQLLPQELTRQVGSQFLDPNRVRTVLTRFDEQPYLVVSDRADDTSGFSMGFLVLVIPVDERFLMASQQGGATGDDRVAVIDVEDQRILASSDNNSLLPGTKIAQWTSDFLVTSQSFAEYEGSEWNALFATFMPHDTVSAMSSQVRRLEKRQQIFSGLVFISVFTLLIYQVSLRLNRVLKRITHFSERALGFQPSEPQVPARGNQLLLLEDQIYQFIRLVVAARTEMRRRHETQIRESEALKSAILQASLDAIVTIDSSGNIIEFNSTAAAMFGYSREAVIGRRFMELFVREEERPAFQALLQASCAAIPDVNNTHAHSELEATRANGAPLPVEVSIVPIALKDAAVYTVYLHDISHRREAERKIQSLAKIASESPSPILRVNTSRVLLYANAASRPLLNYWGCQIGQTLPLFWGRRIERVIEQGRPAEWDVDCDGQLYSLLFAPVTDLSYVNVYGRDITAMRQAEQAARRHQAELVHVCRLSTMGEMATGMAHEINQPLSAITNYAHGCARRMQNGAGSTPEMLEALAQIANQAQRASAIIRRLRHMVGKQPAIRETLDMNQLVMEVHGFIAYDAGRQNTPIELDLWDHPLLIRGDLVQLEQVLLNLLRNALDALLETPTNERRIKVITQPVVAGVQVEVCDNGSGISAETLSHLFEPFYTTKETGMGMGLPISKTILDEHGGKIWSQSQLGIGTRFFVLIPHL